MNLELTPENKESAKLSRDGLMQMSRTDYLGAIQTFDNALEIYPGCLLALQSRALCKTLMLEDLPDKNHQNQFEEIVLDLLTASSHIRNVLIHVFNKKDV
jgi:hypothetical protein